MIGFSILPYITFVPARWLIRHVLDLSTGEFVSAVAGLIVGLVIGLLLGLPMANLPEPYNWILPIGTVVVTGLGMMGLTVAKRARSVRGASRTPGFIQAARATATRAQMSGRLTYVDTSALIDGRITDVVASGFLFGTLVVPRFVVDELQHIADNRDQARRVRGRRGLEVLASCRRTSACGRADRRGSAERRAVDAKLIELARRRGAGILTDDYNLNRVAQLDDVRVLNLNQLANALKPAFLPGDALQVKVIQQGKEPGQGLAYLDDGTMIVVEGGGEMVDTEIEVTVVRVLQTVAGRMVFAQPRGSSRAARRRGICRRGDRCRGLQHAHGRRRQDAELLLGRPCSSGRSRRWPQRAPSSESSSSRAPDRVASSVAQLRVDARRDGRCRRRAALRSVRTASPPRPRMSCSFTMRARPLASPAARRRGRRGGRPARRRGAGRAGRRLAQARRQRRDRASVDRTGLVRTQTPQGARRDCCSMPSRRAGADAAYTDEAALLESRGITVATVPGEADEHQGHGAGGPRDRPRDRRVRDDGVGAPTAALGLGQDTHGFGPEIGLRLGGIVIDDAPRLFGHSDGDVVLHAAATAVLSAAGLGDLGRLFPPTDPRTTRHRQRRAAREAVEPGGAGRLDGRRRAGLVGRRPAEARGASGSTRCATRSPAAGVRCRLGVDHRVDRQPVRRRGRGPRDQRNCLVAAASAMMRVS